MFISINQIEKPEPEEIDCKINSGNDLLRLPTSTMALGAATTY